MREPLFTPADILLPKGDFENWSVIACDQFTSRPDYWAEAAELTNGKPSTLSLIYPEVYLEKTDPVKTVENINAKMNEYLENGVYNEYKNAFIYVERTQSDGKVRSGVVGKIDLDRYDYREGAKAEIRATEKTVIERIPPRVEIRKNASCELPHVLMLMDDKSETVMGELYANKDSFIKLYDFPLMLGGGHIRGWLVPEAYNEKISSAVDALGKGDEMRLAVGDGNHSLASAKACHDQFPNKIDRFALVELVNIHSDALEFEPIYRTVENVDVSALQKSFEDFLTQSGAAINGGNQKITFVYGNKKTEYNVKNPPHSLAVGTVQLFLDKIKPEFKDMAVDYIHGEDEVLTIAKKPSACGFLYGGIGKSELFPAVEKDGTLPRKTFSMGTARDKRYYTEVRKITVNK